ncbi:hypothetical protein [Bacillus massiliglaciei]|uniref:hypothetical protein n=1 Tax=Bacillus massiliglaciei TaxID=1816693 RepID=UPI000DA62226|nr:hypothetical protein [Bacillus massiliglaciei]
MGEFDDIENKFQELEDGRYIVRIEGYKRESTINQTKPIRWDLKLMNDSPYILPMKFSHIETDAGFQILMRELKQLGFSKPRSTREFEDVLSSLLGSIIEINLVTTNEKENYRDIRFVRRLY